MLAPHGNDACGNFDVMLHVYGLPHDDVLSLLVIHDVHDYQNVRPNILAQKLSRKSIIRKKKNRLIKDVVARIFIPLFELFDDHTHN